MSRKILLTYTNHIYKIAQDRLISSAQSFNDFDEYHAWFPWNIDSNFREEHQDIFKYRRGDGYWLWKPYIIKHTLEKLNQGDILFYFDSGCYFIHSCQPLLKIFNKHSLSVMSFTLPYSEKEWTKRDCFKALDCDKLEYTNSKQRFGGYIILRKCKESIQLVNEWLYYAQDPQLITDAPSIAPNYKEFREHRHDQSLFSLLTKKYSLPSFRDPSQSDNGVFDKHPNSPYPQIINSTKERTPIRTQWKNPWFTFKCHYFYFKNDGLSRIINSCNNPKSYLYRAVNIINKWQNKIIVN